MMRLCEAVHRDLTEDALGDLRAIDVKLAHEFLQQDPESLKEATNLPLKTILDIRHQLLRDFAPKVTSAYELTGSQPGDGNNLSIPTGIRDLDQMLRGGFKTGFIYEIFGLPGTGKTQLALTLASQCVLSKFKQSNVVYMDTKNDFKIERLVEILRERHVSDAGGAISLKKKVLLEKIRVKKDFYLSDIVKSLNSVLAAVEEEDKKKAEAAAVKSNQQQQQRKRRYSDRDCSPPPPPNAHDPFWGRIRLLVLDNIGSLVLPELGEDDKLGQVFGVVGQVKTLLRCLANRHNICVLVVNTATSRAAEASTSSSFSGQRKVYKPSLGKIFEDAADIKLFVDKVTDRGADTSLPNPRRIVRMRSDIRAESSDSNSKCEVVISKRGWEQV